MNFDLNIGENRGLDVVTSLSTGLSSCQYVGPFSLAKVDVAQHLLILFLVHLGTSTNDQLSDSIEINLCRRNNGNDRLFFTCGP